MIITLATILISAAESWKGIAWFIPLDDCGRYH
jgi:hypothetical protein